MTDYAVMVVCFIAEKAKSGQTSVTSTEIAQETKLGRPAIGQILNALSKAEILVSKRGVKGGHNLSKAPSEISLYEIISALEGGVTLTDCVEPGDKDCEYSSACSCHGQWGSVNKQLVQVFKNTSIEDMIQSGRSCNG